MIERRVLKMVENKKEKARLRENSLKNHCRKPYRKPQLAVYGALEKFTQGLGSKGADSGAGHTMN